MQIVRRLGETEFRRGGTQSQRIDLAPYREILAGLDAGEGAILELEPGEAQRVVKRRITEAAKERQLMARWLTASSGQLRFQLRQLETRPRATATPEQDSAPVGASGRDTGRPRASRQRKAAS